MKVQCPACEAVYKLDETDLGREARRVKCAKCQEKFYIVNIGPSEPPQPAPAGPVRPCPRCGGLSDDGVECPSCGLLFSRHYYLSGLEHSRAGRLREAIDDLSRAIELQPESAGAYAARGESYLKLGDDEKGLSDLDRAAGLGDGRAADYLAAVKSARGRKTPPPGQEVHAASPPEKQETEQPQRQLFKILIPRLTPEEPDPLKQFIGILGSVLLMVGVFLPFLRVPVIGLSNYFAFSRGDGIVLIVLAAAALLFTLGRRYAGTGYTGFFSAIILTLVFYSYKTRLSEMQRMVEQFKGQALESMAGAGFYPIQLEWGFAVMVTGAVLLLAASAVRTGQKNPPREEKKYIALRVKPRTALFTSVLCVIFLAIFIGLTQYSPFSGRVQQQIIRDAVKGISAAQERYRDENHKFADKTRDLYYIYVPDTALEVKMISADRFKWRASFKHKYGDKPVVYDSMGGMIEE